jgi:hypothetical protein
LVINTSTTIVTFEWSSSFSKSQNKDTLNALIACNEKASNRLIDVEDLAEAELIVLKKFYIKLSRLAESEGDLYSSHLIDEADRYHEKKPRHLYAELKDKGIK